MITPSQYLASVNMFLITLISVLTLKRVSAQFKLETRKMAYFVREPNATRANSW